MVIVPQVSVIMPVYNNVSFLEAAVDSVIDQSLSEFEFIIVDDASTDSSEVLLESLAKKDSRISLHRNATNLGYRKSLNIGLKIAKGKYVARMDADDVSLPYRLERQTDFLDAHGSVGVLGTGAYIVNSNGNIVGPRVMPSSHGFILWWMCFTSPFIHPTVMIRRQLLNSVGGYNTDIVAEDYDLWWRLSHVTRLHNLSEKLLHLRKHGNNQTSRHYESYQRSGVSIASGIVNELLDEDIDSQLVANLWKQRDLTIDQALEVGNLIIRLCNNFRSRVSSKEYRSVRSDTSKRLLRLVLNHKMAPSLWKLVFAGIKINPLIGIDLLISLKNRLLYVNQK